MITYSKQKFSFEIWEIDYRQDIRKQKAINILLVIFSLNTPLQDVSTI